MFGLVATMQTFVRNRTGFLVSRVMLGLAESGYTPGAMYILSLWYKRRELAKRVSIFFFGMFGGNAISPLLATGILKLDGSRGMTGWQWLFLGMDSILLTIFRITDSQHSGGLIDCFCLIITTVVSSREPIYPAATVWSRSGTLVERRKGHTTAES
jgi:MFS family permease